MLALAAALTLAVSPARTVLRAPASRTIQVSNLGDKEVAVDVAWKPLSGRHGPMHWLTITPGRLVLRGRARAFVTVRAGRGASPGDHDLLVLVTGRRAADGRVAVRLRAGVRVRIRAPGRLVHKLVALAVRARAVARHRALLVSLANRGNVTEELRGRVRVTLVAHGRVISRLRWGRFRELYPGTRAVLTFPYAGGARGVVTALVSGQSFAARYRLRL